MDMPFYTRSKYLKIIFNLSKKIKSTYPAVQAFPSGARVFCSQKRHVETRRERTKWGESKGEGLGAGREKRLGLGLASLPLPLFFFHPNTYTKGYYFYSPSPFLRHNIKDFGGFNSATINNQLSPAQITPALQTKNYYISLPVDLYCQSYGFPAKVRVTCDLEAVGSDGAVAW